ncbi:MAG: hypothetical protein SOZ45_05945 [Ruminococcus sp.]|nr:hypothetical protein [Ruminococcus sp.]
MWKKFISCVLVIIMILGTVPYSTVYAESLSNASAEDGSSVHNIDEYAEQPSTSEKNEENSYSQDDSASENIDNSETGADGDDNDDEEMIEQPVPKCAFSFDTPLMRAADANVLKSGSDTTDIEITRFDISLSSGAEKNDNGDYVWTAKNSDSGHPFIFRINYALSGTFSIKKTSFQALIFLFPLLLERKSIIHFYTNFSAVSKISELRYYSSSLHKSHIE